MPAPAGYGPDPAVLPPSRDRLTYYPGLDGLRGLAVAGVLCFHGGWSWAQGGFLGVSTFFTLSGFLITSLLLSEHEASGSISLRTFWARRFRRLMPAALLTLAGIVVFGATAASAGQLTELRGDILAALAYVANWRFIFNGSDYADLFTEPSPVQHFWSLAIEEQFYALYPLVVVGLLALGRRRALVVGLAVLLGASAIVVTIFGAGGADHSRIYYGTDVRAAELLVGALLAVGVSKWPQVVGWRPLSVAANGALLVSIWAWWATDLQAGWLYQGGLILYAVVSAVLVLGALDSTGPLAALLALRPLRYLGRISYGVYLFHWPIFLWLDAERTGLGPTTLFALQVAVTIALAALSARVLEVPIRRGQVAGAGRWLLAPAAVGAIIVGAIVVIDPSPDTLIDFDRANTVAAAAADPTSDLITCADGAEPPPVDARAPRVTLFGDSTALALSAGFGIWARCSGEVQATQPIIGTGCGLMREGDIDGPQGRGPIGAGCIGWQDAWPQTIANRQSDRFLVLFGPWDVLNHRLPGDDSWVGPGDERYDEALRASVERLNGLLLTSGASVTWLTSPYVSFGQVDGVPRAEPLAAADPARMDRYNEIVREAAAADGATVQDLASYVNGLPDAGLGVDVRPDGIHLTEAAALQVSSDLLEPLLAQETVGTNSDPGPDAEPGGGPPPALSDEFSTSRGRLGLWQADTGQPWHQLGGSWEVDDGVAVGDGRDGSTIATVAPGGPLTSVELVAGDLGPGAGLAFRFTDVFNYWAVLAAPATGRWNLVRVVDGQLTVVESYGPADVAAGTVVSIQLDGDRLAVSIDDQAFPEMEDPTLSSSTHVGLIVPQGQRSTFDQISAVRQ